MICNTDGVSIFKSSRTTVWPVYLQIVNLNPSIRYRQENILTCAIWVGQSKPNMDTIFAPILQDLNHMNVVGFNFQSPEGRLTIRLKLL